MYSRFGFPPQADGSFRAVDLQSGLDRRSRLVEWSLLVAAFQRSPSRPQTLRCRRRLNLADTPSGREHLHLIRRCQLPATDRLKSHLLTQLVESVFLFPQVSFPSFPLLIGSTVPLILLVLSLVSRDKVLALSAQSLSTVDDVLSFGEPPLLVLLFVLPAE